MVRLSLSPQQLQAHIIGSYRYTGTCAMPTGCSSASHPARTSHLPQHSLQTEKVAFNLGIAMRNHWNRCFNCSEILGAELVLFIWKIVLFSYFIATPPDRGWQRNEGLLLLHSFLSLDIVLFTSYFEWTTVTFRIKSSIPGEDRI